MLNKRSFLHACFFLLLGKCVVPPVIRANANALKRKGDTDVRCEACWLKLCLIGYNLETTLYDRLRYGSIDSAKKNSIRHQFEALHLIQLTSHRQQSLCIFLANTTPYSRYKTLIRSRSLLTGLVFPKRYSERCYPKGRIVTRRWYLIVVKFLRLIVKFRCRGHFLTALVVSKQRR